MYNFKALQRNSAEEGKFACKYKESIQEKEVCCIKLDLHIQDLSIAQRSRSCDEKKRITVYAEKVQALQDYAAVYVVKTNNSAT